MTDPLGRFKYISLHVCLIFMVELVYGKYI